MEFSASLHGQGEAPRTWLRPLLGVSIFIFYALVIQRLGFFLSTLPFLIIWMRLIERQQKGLAITQ